jgi:hypothetical protein
MDAVVVWEGDCLENGFAEWGGNVVQDERKCQNIDCKSILPFLSRLYVLAD